MNSTPKEYVIINNTGDELQKMLNSEEATPSGSHYKNEDKLDDHISDYDQHVSINDKKRWNNKVDKEDGKKLSSNDFTDELKKKLVDLATNEIYIGTKEPTNPDVLFWINPEANPSPGGGGTSGDFEDGNEVAY